MSIDPVRMATQAAVEAFNNAQQDGFTPDNLGEVMQYLVAAVAEIRHYLVETESAEDGT